MNKHPHLSSEQSKVSMFYQMDLKIYEELLDDLNNTKLPDEINEIELEIKNTQKNLLIKYLGRVPNLINELTSRNYDVNKWLKDVELNQEEKALLKKNLVNGLEKEPDLFEKLDDLYFDLEDFFESFTADESLNAIMIAFKLDDEYKFKTLKLFLYKDLSDFNFRKLLESNEETLDEDFKTLLDANQTENKVLKEKINKQLEILNAKGIIEPIPEEMFNHLNYKGQLKFLIEAIRDNAQVIKIIPNKWLKENLDGWAYYYKQYKTLENLMLEAARSDRDFINYLDPFIKINIQVGRELARDDWTVINKFPLLKNDTLTMLEIIDQDKLEEGELLNFIRLYATESFMLEAVKTHPELLLGNIWGKEFLLKAIKINPECILHTNKYTGERWDPDLLLAALKHDNADPLEILEDLPFYKLNWKVMLEGIKKNWRVLTGIPMELQREQFKNGSIRSMMIMKKIVLEAIGQDLEALNHIDPFVKEKLFLDKDFVKEAIKLNGELLLALPSYKNKIEYRKIALKQNGLLIENFDLIAQRDTVLAQIALENNGLSLRFLARFLKRSKEIVEKAVLQNGLAIQFADRILRDDPKIVMYSILHNPLSLEFAGPICRANRKIVEQAVKLNGLAIQFADPVLRDDPKIVMYSILHNPLSLEFAGPICRANRKIVEQAVKLNGLAMQFADPILRDDPKIVRASILQNALSFEFAGPISRANRKIVEEAVKENVFAIQFADPVLQADPDILKFALQQNPLVLEVISQQIKQNNPKLVEDALKQNWRALPYSGSYYFNKNFLLTFLNDRPEAASLLPKPLLKDKTFIEHLIKKNHNILRYLNHDELKKDARIWLTVLKLDRQHVEELKRSKVVGPQLNRFFKNHPNITDSLFKISQNKIR